ncbi:hypothetical protein ACIRVF_34265 [Kitasatospora sp. NPDC101157]|uniref:hypothetical protein n=1 Tax=Kitasatospora sp. NPDC101157 TaxID=3364098 RepID=UPI003800AC07
MEPSMEPSMEQGARTAVRCGDCGGAAVRSFGQFLDRDRGRELCWDAELHCPSCDLYMCEHSGPGPMPEDLRTALLTAHGPARLRLSGPLGDPVAALRALREGAGTSLGRTRELLAELREFGLAGTTVEMARWRVRLGERGVTTEVQDGFGRAYRYVGPPELRELATGGGRVGQPVRTESGFAAWVGARPAAELAEPFTFVVDLGGALRLAPRRSEHVACANGELVLSAGEIGFQRSDGGGAGGAGWEVGTVSNLSTGYCPDVVSWPAVAAALDRIGLPRPGGFTQAVVFRRCPDCGQCGIVREAHYVCVFCDADLPERWNVDDGCCLP